MRAISSGDARARFGQVLDEVAAGERFIVERAGRPVAAIVPLAHVPLQAPDPGGVLQRRREAAREMVSVGREVRRRYGPFDAAAFIRGDRDR